MKKAWMWSALCALVLPMCAMAAHDGSYRYTVGVDVDAHGQVTGAQIPPSAAAPIAKLLNATVRQWHFHPAMLNRQAVPSHTYVYIRMDVKKLANGTGMLLLRYIDNGPRMKPGPRISPEYPVDERHRRRSEFLRLTGQVMPDGRLDHVRIQSLVPGDGVPGDFRASALEAAKKWRFDNATVGGKPVVSKVQIPVYFAIRDASGVEVVNHRQWVFLRKQEAQRKAQQSADTAGSMPLASGQVASVDSPLRPDRIGPVKVRLTP